jgi:hypothetical protein
MSAETIAKVLGGRRAGGAWMVRCPAHEDRRPSLSVSVAKGGKVLVRCHAGCEQRDVIAALGARGLWETASNTPGRFAGKHHLGSTMNLIPTLLNAPGWRLRSGGHRSRPKKRLLRPICVRADSICRLRPPSGFFPA